MRAPDIVSDTITRQELSAKRETWRCEYCGRANRETTLSCEGCGGPMPEPKNDPVGSSVVPIMEMGNPEPVGWIEDFG